MTMKKKNHGIPKSVAAILVASFSLLCTTSFSDASNVKAAYLYDLSSFTGTVPFTWASMAVDDRNREIYVLYGDAVTVFNDKGMKVYSFESKDLSFGTMYALAVDDEGALLSLFHKGDHYAIVRCNYRGEPSEEIKVAGVPQDFTGLTPNLIASRNGQIYIAYVNDLKIAVLDASGNFRKGYDVAALMHAGEEGLDNREDYVIAGFNVDQDGNIIIVNPVKAKVNILSPDGKISEFGKRGSAPGKFGVPMDSVRDKAGNYYVVDILRCVVIAFDKDFRFLGEFGYRGYQPGRLIGPRGLAIDSNSRLYITQLRQRGVSVFQLAHD